MGATPPPIGTPLVRRAREKRKATVSPFFPNIDFKKIEDSVPGFAAWDHRPLSQGEVAPSLLLHAKFMCRWRRVFERITRKVEVFSGKKIKY
jgi:hypothetical protein